MGKNEFRARLHKNRRPAAAPAASGKTTALMASAVEDVKEGIKDAGQISLAQDVLDALVDQMTLRIPQLKDLPPVLTRAGAALLLNMLLRNYGDALPIDGAIRDVLEGVVKRTPTAAFIPLFTELRVFDILRGAVASVGGAAAAASKKK